MMSAKGLSTALMAGLLFSSFYGRPADSIPQKPIPYLVKPSYLEGMLPPLKGNHISKNFIIDSLTAEVKLLKEQNDSLLLMFNNQFGNVRKLEKEIEQAGEVNKNMEKELDVVRNDNLKSTHTGRILIIFNIIAGIILLVTMIWIINRKKGDFTTSSNAEAKSIPKPVSDLMERKMERIEKLGKLRDKGLLTDDEFLLQKKQILG